MRKLSVKIAIILFAILTTIIAAVSTLVFLINSGKLTPFIERRIKTDTDFDIKIKDVHLDIFSDLQLKQISVKWFIDQYQFAVGCNALTVRYKLFDLLNRRIQGIDISGVQIDLNREEEKTVKYPSLHDYESVSFNINDYYPVRLFVENISINNAKGKFKTDGYLFTLTEMDMRVEEVQLTKPFAMSVKGNFSVSNLLDSTQSNLPGKIDINTKYSLLDDELTILDSSYFLVNDLGKFSISGKTSSMVSTPEIDYNISARELPASNIHGLLNNFMLVDLSSLTLGGECGLNLSIQGNLEKIKISLNSSINNINLKSEDTVFKANVLEMATGATLFPFSSKRIINADGKCVIRRGYLEAPKGQITDINFPIIFTLDYPKQITLSSNDIHGKLHYNDALYSINKLISNIKTNIDLKLPESILLQSQIDTMFSDPVRVTSNIDIRKKTIRDTSLKIHNINCGILSETFVSVIPEKFKEWSLDGKISIDTTTDSVGMDKSQKMTAVTGLSLSQLKFASPDYDYFGEGINGQVKIDTTVDNSFGRFSFRTNTTFDPFLIQLGEFTTDMRGRKTHFSFNGNYDTCKKSITGIESALSWDNLGSLSASGDILNVADNLHLDMNIGMKQFDNAAIFEAFIKDTVEYSNPVLFNTHIKGESNSHFYIKGSKKDLTINGRFNVKDLNLVYGDVSIEDASIDLPVSIAYPRSSTMIQKQDIPESQYGTIQLRKLFCGPLELNDIRLNPIIISNNFFIKDSFKVPVFNGSIDIRNVSVENTINSDRKIELGFQLNNINIKDITTAYQLTPFEGTLSSAVMSFRQQGQKLISKDEINIKLFGGDITIRDLILNNFMTSMREIGFSAEIKHLDLGQMSETYKEWGSITGIINGNIEDFKLVTGEPSRFEIEMKTESYPDIKQTVSTKFLKNFVPGIGKVLDKVGFTNYKYAILGLHARLENDYVKLRGAVREDGKELFMKGAGMKKLEIVFPNVDKRVPFKTFLSSFKGMLGSDIDGTQVQFK